MSLLTDTKARSVKTGGNPLAHGGVTGLALHPSPSHKGQGKWVLRYVSPVTKKRRNAGLGSYCQSNPVDVVGHLLPLQPGKTIRTQHQPAMPWPAVPAFVTTQLRTPQGFEVTRQALVFLILTASRSGEVRFMTWDEVDLKAAVWKLPAERMKAKQMHRVPLSKPALAILKQQRGLHDTLVFPSVRDRAPLSDMTLTALLRRVEALSDVAGRTATAHGFRSSFRDWCSEKGYPRDLAERALAHAVQNKVEAAYHRTDLLEQRRPLMQAWADFVMSSPTRKTA